MISASLAQELKQRGLRWQPAERDFFIMPEHNLDGQVFVVSALPALVQSFSGQQTITFHGSIEWALDYVVLTEAVWLPTETQLRELLATFVAGTDPQQLAQRADRFRVLAADLLGIEQRLERPAIGLQAGRVGECPNRPVRPLGRHQRIAHRKISRVAQAPVLGGRRHFQILLGGLVVALSGIEQIGQVLAIARAVREIDEMARPAFRRIANFDNKCQFDVSRRFGIANRVLEIVSRPMQDGTVLVTLADITRRINTELAKALATPEFSKRLTEQGFSVYAEPGSPADNQKLIMSDLEKGPPIIRKLGPTGN